MKARSLRFAARLGALLLFAALALSAVEPLYRIQPNRLYLPQDGLALDAATGAVAWRFPRLPDGRVYTDGHGLLLISWVARIRAYSDSVNQDRFTRFCRLRAADGQTLWCRDLEGVDSWSVDTGGRLWYVLAQSRLTVLDMSDGQAEHAFPSPASAQLLPLPSGGLLLLAKGTNAQSARIYRPGAAALGIESLPESVYAFQGDGSGLLLYARQRHQFATAAPFRALSTPDDAPPPGDHPFPSARLDTEGFVFTGWDHGRPVLSGGIYGGRPWSVNSGGNAKLALAARQVAVLSANARAVPPGGAPRLGALVSTLAGTESTASSAPPATLQVLDLDSGAERFHRDLDLPFVTVAGDARLIVLLSDFEVRALDARNGDELWRAQQPMGTLAALATDTLVFWKPDGDLAALDRSTGNARWQLHFQSPPLLHHP